MQIQVDMLLALPGVAAFLGIGWLVGSVLRRVGVPTWCRLLIGVFATVLLVIGFVVAAEFYPRCLVIAVLLILIAVAERASSLIPFLHQRAGLVIFLACLGAVLGFGAGRLAAVVQNHDFGPVPTFAPLGILGLPGVWLAGRTGEPGWIEWVKRYELHRVAFFNAVVWAVLLPAFALGMRTIRERLKTSQPKDRQLSSESAPCASSEEVSS